MKDKRRAQMEAVSRKLLAAIGKDNLDELKAAGVGVTIFAFEYKAPGAIAYISTAERAGMIGAIKEWLAFQEAGLTTEPSGERGRT